MNMVACHLGAGASVACIRGGVSIDTSMGLTPLEGCGFPLHAQFWSESQYPAAGLSWLASGQLFVP